MQLIPLTRGQFAAVDDEDFTRVAAFKWCAVLSESGAYYAHRRPSDDNPYLSMHRFIMAAKPGEWVDHRNGDPLDNRRENLRICTRVQNARNRRRDRRNTTGFKGIYFWKPTKRWMAHIRVHGRKYHLGYYGTAEDAARAYDAAAREHYGEFANTNFPSHG